MLVEFVQNTIAPDARPRQTRGMFLKHHKNFLKAQRALEANDYQKADEVFSAILDKDPDAVEARLHRALARLRLQNYETALADAEEIIKTRPDSAFGLMIKGEILLEQKKFDEAYNSLLAACEMERDNGRAFYDLARACIGLGKKHEAADYMELALAFERDYTFAQCFTEILSQNKSL